MNVNEEKENRSNRGSSFTSHVIPVDSWTERKRKTTRRRKKEGILSPAPQVTRSLSSGEQVDKEKESPNVFPDSGKKSLCVRRRINRQQISGLWKHTKSKSFHAHTDTQHPPCTNEFTVTESDSLFILLNLQRFKCLCFRAGEKPVEKNNNHGSCGDSGCRFSRNCCSCADRRWKRLS